MPHAAGVGHAVPHGEPPSLLVNLRIVVMVGVRKSADLIVAMRVTLKRESIVDAIVDSRAQAHERARAREAPNNNDTAVTGQHNPSIKTSLSINGDLLLLEYLEMVAASSSIRDAHAISGVVSSLSSGPSKEREDLEQQLVRNHRHRRPLIDHRSNHRHRRHCLLHP